MDLTNKFCGQPWSFMTIGDRVSSACCWQLHKYKLSPNDSIDILSQWNNPNIQDLRKGVLSGSFNGCNKDTCFYLSTLPDKQDSMKTPYWRNIIENNVIVTNNLPSQIHFEIDNSCNLQCPICHPEFHGKNTMDEAYTTSILWDTLEKAKKESRQIVISMCGNGEPFHSKVCRNFLFNADLRNHSNIKISLNTNGLFLTPKTWGMMNKLNNNIEHIIWSIEGSNEETYSKCRVRGKFHQIVKNLEFVYNIKQKGNPLKVILAYVVYKYNYKDMVSFIKWIRSKWDFEICFQRFISSNSLLHKDLDIFNVNHPLHLDFLEELKNPIFKNTPGVYMTNLDSFLS